MWSLISGAAVTGWSGAGRAKEEKCCRIRRQKVLRAAARDHSQGLVRPNRVLVLVRGKSPEAMAVDDAVGTTSVSDYNRCSESVCECDDGVNWIH